VNSATVRFLHSWKDSQGVYFEPRAGGEVNIFGFLNKKKKKEKKKKKLPLIMGRATRPEWIYSEGQARGVLLWSQGGRQSKDFRGLKQQTDKQTNGNVDWCGVLSQRLSVNCGKARQQWRASVLPGLRITAHHLWMFLLYYARDQCGV